MKAARTYTKGITRTLITLVLAASIAWLTAASPLFAEADSGGVEVTVTTLDSTDSTSTTDDGLLLLTSSSETRYDGEQNALSDEAYEALGLSLTSPDAFDPEDTSDPLEDFEGFDFVNNSICITRTTLSMTLTEVSTSSVYSSITSESSLDLEKETALASGTLNTLATWFPDGGFTKFYEVLHSVQTAIDWDGDGIDEILTTRIETYNNGRDFYYVAYLSEVDEENGTFTTIGTPYYLLLDEDVASHSKMMQYIGHASESLVNCTVGDFDDDDEPEIALYIPDVFQDSGPYVQIAEIDSTGTIQLGQKIYLETLGGANFEFNPTVYDSSDSSTSLTLESYYFPTVSLATTSISGQDDLVINVTSPSNFTSLYPFMNILSHDTSTNEMTTVYSEVFKESASENSDSDTRISHANAYDTDLNGNGTSELVVAGYERVHGIDSNNNTENYTGNNIVKLYTYENGTYSEVFTQTVTNVSDGNEIDDEDVCPTWSYSEYSFSPIALCSGRYLSDVSNDYLYLDGVVFGCENTLEDNSSEAVNFADTTLGAVYFCTPDISFEIAFTSAETGSFLLSAADREQTLYTTYEPAAAYQTYSVETLYAEATENSFKDYESWEYINILTGTVVLLDTNPAEITYEFVDKEYGWSVPELYGVLNSAPYWEELSYNSETFGKGSMTWSMTTGSGTGTENETSVGTGYSVAGEVELKFAYRAFTIAGVGFCDYENITNQVSSWSTENTTTETYTIKAAAGEDYAIIYATPLVIYNYLVTVPEHIATEEELEDYAAMKEQYPTLEDYDYEVGDTVPGGTYAMQVTSQLNPVITALTIEEYNEIVEGYDLIDMMIDAEVDLLSHEIGSPLSYPNTSTDFTNRDDVESFYQSINSIFVSEGEVEFEIALETESEEENSYGTELEWNLDGGAGVSPGFATVAERGEKELFDVDGSITVVGGQVTSGLESASTITHSTNGLEIAASVLSLPEGTSEIYDFQLNLALYKTSSIATSATEDGDTSATNAFVLDYIVNSAYTDVPRLPENFHAAIVTENDVALKWDISDDDNAESYQIYTKDSLGQIKALGDPIDGDTDYYIVTNLSANTTYEYAISSYSEADGEGYESSLSQWITVATQADDTSAPTITQQPQTVVLNGDNLPSTATLSVEANVSPDVEGYATLKYQWAKLETNEVTGTPVWEDIEGATDSTLTVDVASIDEHSYYRVSVTQVLGGNMISVFSSSAAVIVSSSDHEYHTIATQLDAVPLSEDAAVYCIDDTYYIEPGTDFAFEVSFASSDESGLIPEGATVDFYATNEEGIQLSLGSATVVDGAATLSTDALSEGAYTIVALYGGGFVSDQSTLAFVGSVTNVIDIEYRELDIDVSYYNRLVFQNGGLTLLDEYGEEIRIRVEEKGLLSYQYEAISAAGDTQIKAWIRDISVAEFVADEYLAANLDGTFTLQIPTNGVADAQDLDLYHLVSDGTVIKEENLSEDTDTYKTTITELSPFALVYQNDIDPDSGDDTAGSGDGDTSGAGSDSSGLASTGDTSLVAALLAIGGIALVVACAGALMRRAHKS